MQDQNTPRVKFCKVPGVAGLGFEQVVQDILCLREMCAWNAFRLSRCLHFLHFSLLNPFALLRGKTTRDVVVANWR